MKKQSKLIVIIVAVLLVLTAALTVLHLTTREQVPEGALAVHVGENVSYVDLASLQTEAVSGTVINGKGEAMEVSAQGVEVAELLRTAGVDPTAIGSVTITAADEFSAVLSGDEVNEEGKAYLAEDEDGSMKLIVFGDENMKRNVRNVESIYVEN